MEYSQYKNILPIPDEDDFSIIMFAKPGIERQQIMTKQFRSQVLASPVLADQSFVAELTEPMHSKEILALLKKHGFSAGSQWDKDAFYAARNAFNIHSSQLFSQFNDDLLSELELGWLPESLRTQPLMTAHRKASEHGHKVIAQVARYLLLTSKPIIQAQRAAFPSSH